MRTLLLLLLTSGPFTVFSQFGFIKNVVKSGGNLISSGARTIGNGYQAVTSPVRNVATTVYNATLRQPVDEIRNGVNSVLPTEVKDFYKYEIQNRIQPFVSNTTGVVTGEVNVVDGTKRIVDHSIALVKEISLTPELLSLYYAARASSSPIPQEFFNQIKPYWSSVTERTLHIDYAKYIVSSSLLNAITFGKGMEAITFYDVIIFKEPLSMTPTSLSLLSHEMVHVAQYRQLGFGPFLTSYINENLQNGYEQAPKEKEGRKVQIDIYPLLSQNTAATDNSVRLNNVSNVDYRNTTAANLAFFSEAATNPTEFAGYLVTKAQASNSLTDAKAIVGFIINDPQISNAVKANSCRMMSSGPLSSSLSAIERLSWAKSAAYFEPLEPTNWYFLAASAFQVQDAASEYEALMNLSGILVSKELEKSQPDYSKLYIVSGYLDRAFQLINYVNFQQGTIYDNRMPILMLVELGIYLPLDPTKDLRLNQYAQTLANIDAGRNFKDEIHIRVMGSLAGAHLYFAIQNNNFFQTYRTNNYLFEKRNRAVACINTAQSGFNELNMYQSNSNNYLLLRNMFENYIQQASMLNN